MKSTVTWLLSAIVFLFSVEGCTRRPPLVEQPPPSAFTEWLPALTARSDHWRSYQAKVHLRGETSEKKFSLNGIILARLPDQFRLDAFRLGQTAGVLILNHGQPSLFIPSEKAVYTADRSERLIEHFLGIALPLDALGYSLSASLPPDQLAGLQLVRHDSEWVGYAKPSPEGWAYAWHFLSSPQEIRSVRVNRGAWDYTIRYDPPVGLGSRNVPQKITFNSTQWQIVLTVEEIAAVPTPQDSIFSSSFAGDLRHIDLSSHRSEIP
jgi:outer membrane biogenesis lipoprotein LolB